jgi:hypothetical protein
MSRKICHLAVALIALAFVFPASSGLAPVTSLTGEWKDSKAGRMLIRQDGPVLDIQGSDEGSSYQLTCVAQVDDRRLFNCVGQGLNMEDGPTRFIYRSKMKFDGANGIAEEWEALSGRGAVKGTESYKRTGSAGGTR